jgi:hypothetical protein
VGTILVKELFVEDGVTKKGHAVEVKVAQGPGKDTWLSLRTMGAITADAATRRATAATPRARTTSPRHCPETLRRTRGSTMTAYQSSARLLFHTGYVGRPGGFTSSRRFVKRFTRPR